MAALVFENPTNSAGHRSFVLRVLDVLAEWLMRQELRVINRGTSDAAKGQPSA